MVPLFGRYPNDESLMGLTRAEAERKLDADDRVGAYRIYDFDELRGRTVMSTLDYRSDRVNLRIVGGVVTAAEWY